MELSNSEKSNNLLLSAHSQPGIFDNIFDKEGVINAQRFASIEKKARAKELVGDIDLCTLCKRGSGSEKTLRNAI